MSHCERHKGGHSLRSANWDVYEQWTGGKNMFNTGWLNIGCGSVTGKMYAIKDTLWAGESSAT